MLFQNRAEAGKGLAKLLVKYKNSDEVILYALPRGGAVVAGEIAKELHLPLDLIITRKIGHPFQSEYAIAAVSENGKLVVNENEVSQIDKNWFKQEVEKEIVEAKRRREKYSSHEFLSPKDKIAILVDDGIATGLTMFAAIKELKSYTPRKLIVAVPVCPSDTAETIGRQVDELVCLKIDENYLGSVGAYYQNFPQVEDSEVIEILRICN